MNPRLFVAEWQTNTRLRLASWLMLLFALVHVMLFLRENTQEMLIEHERLAMQAAQLTQLAGKSEWLEKARSLVEERNRWQADFLEAESSGMDQATLQSRLNALMEKYELAKPRLQVTQPAPLAEARDILEVTASIDMPFDLQKLLSLLHELEAGRKPVTIERLEFAAKGRPRCTLTLKAYFLLKS